MTPSHPDLVLSRARLADLALVKDITNATVDPKFSRQSFDKLVALLRNAQGRLLLRAQSKEAA